MSKQFPFGDKFLGTIPDPFNDGPDWGVVKLRYEPNDSTHVMGHITGNPSDLYEAWYTEELNGKINECSWKDACRQKRDLILKEGTKEWTWKLRDGGVLVFDMTEIIDQLNDVINEES
jgi:hypothetical protein